MKFKEVLLAVAIIVLTIFVAFYGINTFFPSPQYETFCASANVKSAQVFETQKQLEDAGGQWTPQEIRCITTPCPQGYCDLYTQCNNDYQDAMKARSRNVFYLALPLGILIVLLGAFVFGLEPVGTGIMGGGVGTLIYGAGAYWPYGENWIRFLISLIGLVILVWFVYWFNRKAKRPKKK